MPDNPRGFPPTNASVEIKVGGITVTNQPAKIPATWVALAHEILRKDEDIDVTFGQTAKTLARLVIWASDEN